MKPYIWFLVLVQQVTSIGMESALVDKHLDGSAFVYGSMGFIDKVLCGVALYFLESFEGKLQFCAQNHNDSRNSHLFCADADPVPCNPAHACFSVTRFSLGFIPGIAALLGVIVSFTMKLHTSHKKPLAEPLLAQLRCHAYKPASLPNKNNKYSSGFYLARKVEWPGAILPLHV